MALTHDQGIVLRSFPFGEADRVVVLLSPTRGKVRAVAKGVRKTKSRFGGRLEPFTHVDVVLYEGRNLDTVTQVAVIEAYPHLRGDLERVAAAGTMVEVADAVAQEQESSVRLFLLLRRGLRVLESGPAHPDVVAAFLVKAAAAIGLAPSFEVCADCGADTDLHRFNFAAGGVQCDRCRAPGAYSLRPGLTDYLATLARTELADLPASDPVLARDALGVARRFVEYHLDRRLAGPVLLDG